MTTPTPHCQLGRTRSGAKVVMFDGEVVADLVSDWSTDRLRWRAEVHGARPTPWRHRLADVPGDTERELIRAAVIRHPSSAATRA